MVSHFFLLRDALSPERLGWMEELLKFYFLKLNPQSFLHASKERDAAFIFFLTGDAVYSLQDPSMIELWENFLSLPSIKIVCDQEELALRGIATERLKMKNPELVITHNSLALNGRSSFWKDVTRYARQHDQPIPSTIGYLHMASPYMNRSSGILPDCLGAALESHASCDLYCYLDGVHICHDAQNPVDAENIGNELENLDTRAGKRGLHFQIYASARCAETRGYCIRDQNEGLVPVCTIRPVKIRELNDIAMQFRSNHIIISENCASFFTKKENVKQSLGFDERGRVPPITILVTRHPLSAEYASGALDFAIACASRDIQTRVIFIENGVYALSRVTTSNKLQEAIDAASGSKNLQFFVFTPSLSARNISKNPKLTGVIPISIADLGNLLFFMPTGVVASHQRIFFF
jgi:tRNA 2-thiouridine synthesizing protein C